MDFDEHDEAPVPSMAQLCARMDVLIVGRFEMWTRYLAHGGKADFLELEAYLGGALLAPADEVRTLAHVVWEAEEFG